MNSTIKGIQQPDVPLHPTEPRGMVQCDPLEQDRTAALGAERPRAAQRPSKTRWQEFDDTLEEMNSLGLSDRMRQLAITPILLDELAIVRDEWRWPSSLDTVDLLGYETPL